MSDNIFADAVIAECERRLHAVYATVVPLPQDSREKAMAKAEAMLAQLNVWALDPVEFFRDCVWLSDPKGIFGSQDVPRGLSPRGMVPYLDVSTAQRDLIRQIHRLLNDRSGLPIDLFVDKSRQMSATYIVLGVFLHAWLFRPGTKLVVGTYDVDLVDPGGKGHRTSESLFGRLRLLLDGFIWTYPNLRFGQGRVEVRRDRHVGQQTEIGMQDSEDRVLKLTRPKWVVHGAEMFEDARSNVIMGMRPDDQFGKSDAHTAVLMDEMGEYVARIGPDADRKAFQAVRPATLHIIMVGTIPEGGGIGTLFEEMRTKPSSDRFVNFKMNWRAMPHYLKNGYYICGTCGKKAKVRAGDDPGYLGREYVCNHCEAKQFVPRRAISSPWWEATKESLNHDPVAIGRYYEHDPSAALTDTVFPDFKEEHQVVRVDTTGGDWITMMGFDPGYSERNPAAWVMARYSDAGKRLHIVAAHQAAGWSITKWVPFFRCWPSASLSRKKMLHLSSSVDQFFDARDYRAEEVAILDRISRFIPGEIHGDKYGTHNDAGGGAAYDQLERYGIKIRVRYSSGEDSPENALVKLRDVWMPRITVEPEVAEHRPWSKNGFYPSFVQSVQSAKWITTEGHGQPKRDVSEKEPRSVKHFIDAMRYMMRSLDSVIMVKMSDQGMPVVGRHEDAVVTFGEIWDRQFGGSVR